MAIQKPFLTIPSWDEQLIKNPPAIFRGTPFWSWNGTLDRDRLMKQLDIFQKMGMGGGHIHVRTGLTDEYLGDTFMGHVKAVVDEAKRRDMLTWLYDEDRWPSGFAGGLVTKDHANRTRQLLMTTKRPEPGETRMHIVHHDRPQPVTDRTFIAAWALRFEDTKLASWRRIEESEDAGEGEVAYYAYVEVAPDITWFNNQQYANLLDPKAIRKFIEVTHERYREVVGDEFGKTIPSMFTDEPLFIRMGRPMAWDDREDIRMSWVDDLPQTYEAAFDEDLLDRLPAVMFDAADGSSPQARWRLRDHHTQRFVDAFAKQLGTWCGENNISLTGHMMAEASLSDQSRWVGEAMRSLNYFQLPGIDMLCDWFEMTTAKQAQSAARQNGRPGTLSELYGVTGWDFTFAGHLRQGNWQAALGVIVRVHHLSWYSMAGEAKRDYPASMGWHVPWWPEYPAVEDHFARVSAALQTGRPVCKVGMLHPIESHWVAEGPVASHADAKQMLGDGFKDTLSTLLEAQIDTDLVAESLLPILGEQDDSGKLVVGEMRYDVLVIPPVLTLRSSTLERLERFVDHGGTVVLLGEVPTMVDAVKSDRVEQAAKRWLRCGSTGSLVQVMEPWRDLELVQRGHRTKALYQLREEADGSKILFVCSTQNMQDVTNGMLRIRGHYHVELIDTQTGDASEPGEVWTDQGWTELGVDLYEADHVLLRLHEAEVATQPVSKTNWDECGRLSEPVDITLDEPNVLVLDRFAWSLDGGDWQDVDEVLRVDNHVRAALGLPNRTGGIAQPWCEPAAEPTSRVVLRCTLHCDVGIKAPKLALERAGESRITVDGQAVTATPDGFYVDEDIATLALPDLAAGEHDLQIESPFRPGHGLEAMYLLGDFGVSVAGTHARIIAPPRQLYFDDYTKQGLPFYGGNVTYHCKASLPEGATALRVAKFDAPLLTVDVDGKRMGRIIKGPYRVELEGCSGEVQIDLTCFGDRSNTFGALHNCNPRDYWLGPPSFRTGRHNWSDGYMLKRKGIYVAPILEQVVE